MSANPFRPAAQVAPKIKAFVYGASGVGKTVLALTAPGPIAAIDTEGGMAFYAKRAGKDLSRFDVLPTKTYRDLQAGIAYVREHPAEYATLVIDPITVVYETLQDAAQIKRAERRRDPDADLEMLDWQRIKRAYKSLMTELVNLPVHVIVVARERDETEQKGDKTVKVGYRPDAEKGTPYFFDIVLRLAAADGGREAVVQKDRTGAWALGARIPNPTFDSLFGTAIAAGAGDTGARTVQDDNQAAAIDAAEDDLAPWRPVGVTGKGIDATGGLVGQVEARGAPADMQLRTTPDGPVYGFGLKARRKSLQVVATGPLAEALAERLQPDDIVTGFGVVDVQTFDKGGRTIEYLRLTVDRVAGDGWALPDAAAVDDLEDLQW